jgi:hypothetical protein
MSNHDREPPAKRKERPKGSRKYARTKNGPFDLAVLCLARGMSVREAAMAAGMSEPTLHRRLHDESDEVGIRIADIRKGMLEGATAILTSRSQELATVICTIATCPEESSHVRLKAAVEGLKAGANLRAEALQDERLKRLERLLGVTEELPAFPVAEGAEEAEELVQRVEGEPEGS